MCRDVGEGGLSCMDDGDPGVAARGFEVRRQRARCPSARLLARVRDCRLGCPWPPRAGVRGAL